IVDALSLVMSKRGILMYNADQIGIKLLVTTTRKALELNPENELARSTLDGVQVDLEIEELFMAMNNHKMNRACRLAVESKHQEVRDAFFKFINDTFKNLDTVAPDKREKLFLLRKIAGWCSRVDESHPVLIDIYNKIRRLE
ncbi:unnamed protein product, partial [marine sediment metagenome]